MKKKISSHLFQLLKIGLAVGLLIYLVRSGRLDLAKLQSLLSPDFVILGFTLIGVILFLTSERWRLLLRQQNFKIAPVAAFKLTLIGNFFNMFVPGGVGGDLVKAVLIAKDHPGRRGEGALTVLVDRVLGLFTMTLLALASFSFEPELLQKDGSVQVIFIGLICLLFGFLFAFWLLLSKHATRLRSFVEVLTIRVQRLHKLWIFAQSYRLSTTELLKLFLLSLGSQLCSILFFMLTAYKLADFQYPGAFFFSVPVGFMVMAVPLAPGGIGIGQAAFYYLFTKAFGRPTEIGTVGVTGFQAFQIAYGMIGAGLFVLLKRAKPELSMQNLEKSAEALTQQGQN